MSEIHELSDKLFTLENKVKELKDELCYQRQRYELHVCATEHEIDLANKNFWELAKQKVELEQKIKEKETRTRADDLMKRFLMENGITPEQALKDFLPQETQP